MCCYEGGCNSHEAIKPVDPDDCAHEELWFIRGGYPGPELFSCKSCDILIEIKYPQCQHIRQVVIADGTPAHEFTCANCGATVRYFYYQPRI